MEAQLVGSMFAALYVANLGPGFLFKLTSIPYWADCVGVIAKTTINIHLMPDALDGVVSMQAYLYFNNYPEDPVLMKVMVRLHVYCNASY
jgi:hypothetical protein